MNVRGGLGTAHQGAVIDGVDERLFHLFENIVYILSLIHILCYINEWGTTRDLEQARIWGEKACQAGESHGEEVLEKLDAIEAERKQKEQEEQPKRRGLFGRRKK